MARTNWNREQTLAALGVYCRTPFGKLHARNPEIIQVAAALDRSPSALAMKCCNLASHDPAQRARGISGLSKASKLDRQIWNEFQNDPEAVSFEAESALAALSHRELEMADSVEWEDVRGLDLERMTRVRVNQSFFRTMILAGYRTSCAVCELPVQTLLVASHIVPWSVDPDNRMNPRNGICLCSLHDKAFDRGLLTLDEELHIGLSHSIHELPESETVESYFLRFDGRCLKLPDRWTPDPSFIRTHNELQAIAG